MRRRVLLLALAVVSVPIAVAHAQSNDGGNNAMTVDQNASASASVSASVSPGGRSLTGYGYSDPKPATRGAGLQVRSGVRATHRPTSPAAAGPVATLPGFEMLPEGGSRLFVELTQTVQVDERKARGTVTYVLHGTHVTVHNNQNPLVTVHFNTPVTRARLVPTGRDLLFVVDLRADVSPTWKMNPGKEGTTVLTVDFPKGTYVSAAAPP